MPKKAPADDAMDPVRARLAGEAAAPVRKRAPRKAEPAGEQGNGTVQQPSRRVSKPRVLTVNRKIMVTEQEAEQIEEMTGVISRAFGSKVTYSQVSRALWSIVGGAEDALAKGVRRGITKLVVPSTGDHVAMAEYEKAIAEFLVMALKRS